MIVLILHWFRVSVANFQGAILVQMAVQSRYIVLVIACLIAHYCIISEDGGARNTLDNLIINTFFWLCCLPPDDTANAPSHQSFKLKLRNFL